MLNDTIMGTICFLFDRGEDNNVIWIIERKGRRDCSGRVTLCGPCPQNVWDTRTRGCAI